MEFTFYKYQGTGNDFLVLDNRELHFPKGDSAFIASLCERKFGVGADGLILLEDHDTLDFKMVYFNADGNLGSMCGNGGRCIVHFANFLKIIAQKTTFEAIDGVHEAYIEDQEVALKMGDVANFPIHSDFIFLDTGSPHHVEEVIDVAEIDVFTKGKAIRNNKYGDAGANINFISKVDTAHYKVRTYERGVENETLSCGTGVTAVALAMHAKENFDTSQVLLETEGGTLRVRFTKTESGYTDIYLIGPAKQVYRGELTR